MIKKAMILAAGFGKRILPLTLNCPKPLLKIGEETLLSNTLKFLELFGIRQTIVNVHYLGEQIVDYINKIKFNLNINIVKEKDKILKKYKLKNIVLDPVMIAKGGEKLISNSSIKHLKKLLLPLCTLVTPNIPEAEVLTGYSISSKEDMIKAAKKILNMGSKNVLLKGGHNKSKMIFDILATKKGIKIFTNRKIRTKNTHGTGCTLSSALATCLSQKKNIIKSCKISLRYVDKAIVSAPGYGKGFGPLNHLVSFNLRNINV